MKRNYEIICLMNIDPMMLNKMLGNRIQQYIKNYITWPRGVYYWNGSLVHYIKINQYSSPCYQTEEEKLYGHIKWCRKKIWQNLFIIKKLRNLGIENFLHLIMYKNPTANIRFKVKDWMLSSLGQKWDKNINFHPSYLKIVLDVLASVIKHKKEIEGIHIWKKEIKLLYLQMPDAMIVYIAIPRNLTERLLKLISSFIKVAGYKKNIKINCISINQQ